MKNRWFFLVIGFSIAIRLAVMPITAHGDLFYIWSVPTLAVEGVWQPYAWASRNYFQVKNSDFDVYYPPLTYLATGSWLIVVSKVSATLMPWLVAARDKILSLTETATSDYLELAAAENIGWNIFLLKTFYLFVETGIVFLIWKLAPKEFRRKAIILWLANPVVIYTGYLMGQIDFLSSALVLAAVYIGVNRGKRRLKIILATVAMVLAVMVKTLPGVLLPALVFGLGKNWRHRLILAGVGGITFVIFNLPWAGDFYRLKIAYLPPVMHGAIDLSFRPDSLINVSKLLIAGVSGLFLATLWVKSGKSPAPAGMPQIIAATMFLFFAAYRGVMINHYVALIPFLILAWIKERGALKRLMVFSLLAFAANVYTRSLLGELFYPTGITWLVNFPSIRELVSPVIKYEHLSLTANFILGIWLIIEAVRQGRKASYAK